MLETERSSSRSHEFEKPEGYPLETISSRTPVNESDEQGVVAGPEPGPGPVVHNKVSPQLGFLENNADQSTR